MKPDSKTRFQLRIEIFRENIRDYEMGEYMNGKKPTPWGYVRWAYLDTILFFIKFSICKRRGHKYENSGGYANGDSGTDYFTCTRCGHEFSHIYY
jgi:hypothetical protein